MEYVGKTCPYCKSELKHGENVVVCSICEMPHHKECWIENKACTTFGCTGTISGMNMSFCAMCGATANEGQKFCATCGNPLTNATPQQNNQSYQYQPVQPAVNYTAQPPQQLYAYGTQPTLPYSNTPQPQPYAHGLEPAPLYSTAPPPPQPQYQYNYAVGYSNNIDPDVLAFLNSNQTYYLDRFNKLKTNNEIVSWNWPAFLFGCYWFAYRKMHLIAIIYATSALILSLASGALAIIPLVASICSGIFGNYLYMRYVDNELAVAKQMPDMLKQSYINKKGRTSAGMVWAYLGTMVAISLLVHGAW